MLESTSQLIADLFHSNEQTIQTLLNEGNCRYVMVRKDSERAPSESTNLPFQPENLSVAVIKKDDLIIE